VSTTIGSVPSFDCFLRSDGNYIAGACEAYFWQCSNGRSFLTPCAAPSLRFNAELNACLSPSQVPGCRHDSNNLPPVVHPCVDRPNGFYPDPNGDCSKFSLCVDNLFYSLNCELSGNVFDQGTNRCNAPERVVGKCGTAQPARFSCVGRPDGDYRSPMDCAVHYTCRQGVVQGSSTCPLLQAFDSTKQQCQPALAVPECAPNQNATLGEQFCSLQKVDDIYPDPTNCHRSIICLRGDGVVSKAFAFLCADPKLPAFDPVSKRCVAQLAGCV
jgi:hypothetical protein